MRKTIPPLLIATLLAASTVTPASAQPPATSAPTAAPFVMPPITLTEPGPGGVRVAEPGVFGNYFTPPPGTAGRQPGVLLLGGSEGGLGAGSTREARLLAAHGFAVLQLAYFGAPGTPAVLKGVPLETFDRGLAWLRARPEVDAARTAVVGTSKGAEAALLIAASDAKLKAVIAASPSSVAWTGIDMSSFTPASSWSRGGGPVPFLRFGMPDPGTPGIGFIYSGYAKGLQGLAANPEAAIPVERAKAAIMLICGGADTLWPSCPMSEAVVARVTAKTKRTVRFLRYPEAGHTVFGPPVPASAPGYTGLASLGGTADANNAARMDDWPKALAFLDANLAR